MFDGELELSLEEEEKIQNPTNIYSLIKTLQFIESGYATGHIDRESYIKEANIILEQYENAKNAYQDYEGLDNFVKHYKLEDCSFAINRIKNGLVRPGGGPIAGNIQKMTQSFNDLNIFLDYQTISVSDVVPMYFDLWNNIEDLKNLINLQNEDINKIKQCFLNLKNNRKASDILTDEEKKQMKVELGLANSTISKQISTS